MKLKALYDTQDAIPEAHRPLYTERDGKWELTGVEGVKSEAEFGRVQESLRKERNDHAAAKAKLQVWEGMDHDDVMAKLDKIPELEELAKGQLSEEKIKEIAEKRVNAVKAPLEREINKLKKENEQFTAENKELKDKARQRVIHDAVRAAAAEGKVQATAVEDVLMLAERVFEVTEDGKVVTRDNVGATPGIEPKLWLQDMQQKRPHWWPPSQGGGAGGSGGGGGFADNPWARENWNITKQGEAIRKHGIEKATQMAKAAGSNIGAVVPPSEKK